MSKTISLLVILSLVLCGCAGTQKLLVSTTPPGASVTLIRFGVTETTAGVPGIGIGGVGDPFEDAPIVLGTSPLEYEFELEDSGQSAGVAGVFIDVTRKFTEGLIRAEKGGVAAERRVRFTGKPITIDLVLPAE